MHGSPMSGSTVGVHIFLGGSALEEPIDDEDPGLGVQLQKTSGFRISLPPLNHSNAYVSSPTAATTCMVLPCLIVITAKSEKLLESTSS